MRRRAFVSLWLKAGSRPRTARFRARHIGPATVVVERDVDAVVVGAEDFLEEPGRADAEARVAAPGLDRNALVVGASLAARTTWPRGMAMDCMINPVAGSHSQ